MQSEGAGLADSSNHLPSKLPLIPLLHSTAKHTHSLSISLLFFLSSSPCILSFSLSHSLFLSLLYSLVPSTPLPSLSLFPVSLLPIFPLCSSHCHTLARQRDPRLGCSFQDCPQWWVPQGRRCLVPRRSIECQLQLCRQMGFQEPRKGESLL